MSSDIPPLLVLSGETATPQSAGFEPEILTTGRLDRQVVIAFAAELVAARSARGVTQGRLQLADDRTAFPDEAGFLIFPHIFALPGTPDPLLAWERAPTTLAEEVLGAEAATITHWAALPETVRRAAGRANKEQPSSADSHFSFRWILHNQFVVASVAAQARLDHVSVHCTEAASVEVARFLVDAVGLVEVVRPETIPTPGRWFVSANAMIHISTRVVTQEGAAGAGSAPNHICLAVDDLTRVRAFLEAAGGEHSLSGSLTEVQQMWVRLSDNLTFEVQAPSG